MTETTDHTIPDDRKILALATDLWRFEGQRRVDSGGSCRVWAGCCLDGEPAFLKWYPEPRSLRQEQQAIRDWLPQIPQGMANQSRLIAASEEHRLLLLSTVPGELVESRSWPVRELHLIHHQAGSLLRELHRLDTIDDSISLDDALRQRLEGWIGKGEGILDEDQLNSARQYFVSENLFASDQRTLCHNDYQPRNWLWDGERIGIIDWEHAHPNHPAFDLVKLQVGAWHHEPRLRESFLAGYQQIPAWLEDERMDAIVALYALGCVVWGTQHRQPDLIALGHRCLL